MGSLNFWLRLPNVTPVGAEQMVFCIGSENMRVVLTDGTGADVGKLYVQITAMGTDGSAAFSSRTSAHKQSDGWLHIQASWNTKAGTSCLYVNDVSDNNVLANLGYRPVNYIGSTGRASFGSASAAATPGQYGACLRPLRVLVLGEPVCRLHQLGGAFPF